MIQCVAHVIRVGGAPMPEPTSTWCSPSRRLSPRNSRPEDRKRGLLDDFTVGRLVIDRVA